MAFVYFIMNERNFEFNPLVRGGFFFSRRHKKLVSEWFSIVTTSPGGGR